MVLVAVIFAIIMRLIKKHRTIIFLGGIAVLCLISGVYTYLYSDSVLPSRHPVNQVFYTPEYMETQEFPDGFLRLYADGRKVYVKDDAVTNEEACDAGLYWQYSVHHYYNMVHFLEAVNAEVIPDKTMNDCVVGEDRMDEFENIGCMNDMLRNMMLYSGIDHEMGNYLYSQWYYREHTKPVYLYANAESLAGAEDIVVLWQPQKGDAESEDMYLMGRDYFEAYIK